MRLPKRTILLLIPAMLLGVINCFSQDELGEEICVFTDRNYYLAGDVLHYVVYCTEKRSGEASGISALANVDLLNREGEVIFRERVVLKNGKGYGSFRIPPEVGSGEKILRCYTSWMRNFGPGSFHYTPLLIIHPAKKYTPLNCTKEILELPPELTFSGYNQTPQIRISGLNGEYNSRDSIVFTLQPVSGSFRTARLSLSVSRSESRYPDTFLSPKKQEGTPHRTLARNKIEYMPDMRGLQLSGTVQQSVSGEPLVNRDVLLSFIDTISEIKGVKSNSSGRFHFDLSGTLGRKDMIIQVPGENENLILTIDPDYSVDAVPAYAWTHPDRANPEGLFREMLLEQQIDATYNLSPDHASGMNPDQITISNKTRAPLPFYGLSDHEIIMDEFVRLPNMEEVFRELGKRVFLARSEGSYRVLLLDLETNRIIGERPWYFLDGVPFFDSEILLAIDPSQLKSIALKSQKYFVGDLVMDGIIDIHTIKGDASLIDFPRSAVRQYYYGFPEDSSPTPKPAALRQEKIPLFKTTLLFEPYLFFDRNNEASISLIAPDSKGSYTIAVRGISSEGFPIRQDFSFHIK